MDRILAAALASIAERGAAGATIEHVAERAGVSRGALHYYFENKEQMIVEAIRRDGEWRGAMLSKAIDGATSPDGVMVALTAKLDDNLRDHSFFSTLFELTCEGQKNARIREELAVTFDGLVERVGEALARKRDEGVLAFEQDPVAVARALYVMATGYALQLLNDPDADHTATFQAGLAMVRSMLSGGG